MTTRAPAWLSATLAVACVSLAQARIWEVTANPDMTFTPSPLVIYQNDQVIFRNAGGVHNVVADDNSFRCAVNCNTNTAPSALLWSSGVQFRQVRSIGYYCEQHGNTQVGMRGVIVVLDRIHVDGFDPPASAGPTAP